MKRMKLCCLFALLALFLTSWNGVAAEANQPLRVFIRGGIKTHGPNQHDHPRFLGEWTRLLTDRGAQVSGAMTFPTPAQLEQTDVVIIYAADGMKIVGNDRIEFEKFLRRGGGLVVVHDGVVAGDEHTWAKRVQGGAWIWNDPQQPGKKTKWFEGEVGIYVVKPSHPIVAGLSNFDWKDEIYHDLDMAPDAEVLATSFQSVFVVAPQLWTYEKTWDGGKVPYRAFVSLPGHEYDVFNTPHYRSVLLRGVAWAGKRANIDEFCLPGELASLKYPEGGPTAPERAAERLQIHPEFSIDLVASEPLVEKVLSLDWDPQGRLWVAETPEYPGGRTVNTNDQRIAVGGVRVPLPVAPGTEENRTPRDRVSWLEDSNGDGRMDRKHVFADGLELITSLVFYRDGVIVAQAPHILWLRDTNGDGRCNMNDERVVLYTGFGTFDTHAVINNFRWGFDGWIYGAVGYSAGHPKSLDGRKDFGRVTAGIFRFRPDGSALEQYASGSCNTWGLDVAPDGELFYTTATCGEHLLHIVMPEKAVARGNIGGVRASAVIPDHQKIFPAVHHTRPAYVQIDWVGMFTAAAGACVYDGGAWPERFQGSHFLSETTMSLVHHEFLQPKGSTYTAVKDSARAETEFIAGTDLWFRPVHTRVGPDGALYVVDFYNQAAIHNDTRGPGHGARNAAARPDRDHHFARIWRVQHRAAKTLNQPPLDRRDAAIWLAALGHENGWVRRTAHRLLSEHGGAADKAELVRLAQNHAEATVRMHALYLLQNLNQLDEPVLIAAFRDRDATVRKNALRIAGERADLAAAGRQAVVAALADANPRARLQALVALGASSVDADVARAVVQAWPSLADAHQRSAAVGVAAAAPLLFLEAVLNAPPTPELQTFAGHISRVGALRQDAAVASEMVRRTALAPAAADPTKQAVLEMLVGTLRPGVVPEWTPELEQSLRQLLRSARPGLPGAVLPLLARWDAKGVTAADVTPAIARLITQLQDTAMPDEQRGQVAANLVGVRKLEPSIVPAVARLLGAQTPVAVQRRVIDVLGATTEPASAGALLAAYSRVPVELQENVLGHLLRRADWSLALVQALSDRTVSVTALGASGAFRLRTHADAAVAARANQVIDALKGPEEKEKEALIARLKPWVERTDGEVENGKKLFLANCAACHVFKDQGRDLAPNLTGMGAHGPVDLLVHVVDPNRVVEPNFISTSIETKDDLSYDGVIARENNVELVLRNAATDVTVRKDEIKSRRSTGRSLMPEGFEALGGEGLRDLMAYLCADEVKFRILDLSPAFTADTSKGIYHSEEAREETLRFRRFGTFKVGDVPFDIVSPKRSVTGKNVVVLRGGAGLARTFPQKVECKAGMAMSQLHFLGGIGGWAWPYGGEDKHQGLPVMKVTLWFQGGQSEEIILKNGVEIADYVARFDVPGSKEVPDLLHNGRQLRWFSKPVKNRGVVERITFESFNNVVAPTLVGLTAELAAPRHAAAAP